jgi:hypothetical protein
MNTTAVALNDGPAFRLGQVVMVRGERATLFQISALGFTAQIKYLANGRKETVRVTELGVGAAS